MSIPQTDSLAASSIIPSKERAAKRGEVRLHGLLLCERHAMQLTLEDRADALLGIVLVSGRVLQSADIRADALRAHRVELQQEEAIEQLRFTRTQLELFREA